MGWRGLGSAWGGRAGRAIVATVSVLVVLVPIPVAAIIIPVGVGFQLAVAPTCVVRGAATRIVILGSGWGTDQVKLSQNEATLGTVTPRTSPVRQQPGTFSFTATVTANDRFAIVARQGEVERSAAVAVQTSCPLQISVKPPCLTSPGPVQVSGSGFGRATKVPVDIDPFGSAEAPSQTVTADGNGNFSTTVDVPFAGATVPIVATGPGAVGATAVPPARAVAFVDPCPPPPPTTTTTTITNPDTTSTTGSGGPGGTTTTSGSTGPGPTTTTGGGGPTPADPPPPPEVPPVSIPTPGGDDTAQVSISPRTVRPGRCNVIVVTSAPPGLGVVARFADGPPVNGQTGPDGAAVVSVCHPHDSGIPLGPVGVHIGIGPLPPAPVFTVLRVPPRPQPPLLQAAADSRRS